MITIRLVAMRVDLDRGGGEKLAFCELFVTYDAGVEGGGGAVMGFETEEASHKSIHATTKGQDECTSSNS